MKTRNLLMFTASVTSLSSISTADSDNMVAIEQSTPAIAMTAAANAVAVPEVVATPPAVAVAASIAVTPSIEAAVAEVAVPSAAVAEVIASPVFEGPPAIAAAIPAEALTSETIIDFVDMAPAAMPADMAATLAVEPAEAAVTAPAVIGVAVAAITPLIAPEPIAEIVVPAAEAVATPPAPAPAEIAVPAMAVEPVAKLSEASVAEAVPATQPLADTGAPALGKVAVPEAPQYMFFDDAAAAAPAAAMQSSAVDYTGTVTLDQAIAAALETSPEINQAIMNKEAIEFEREQAQGLYLPRVDIEASAGIRRLENPTRRTLGIEDDALYPLEAGITAEQTVIDFGRRHGELMRQAARTDGAALRVAERSENTALLVSRQYLDILLQQRIVAAADDNVTFHRNLVGDLGQGVQQGSISIADQQQAQERLQAAIVRKTEAEEALVNAQIQLQTLTGLSIGGAAMPQSLRAAVSPTLGEAVAEARQNNPKVKEASADVDAAHAMVEKANGDLYPTIGVDARGRVGEDIDGFNGKTNDVQARVVFKWNIFDGGINRAKYQEMVRRASEARFRLHELGRYAEEDTRRAWNSMSTQRKVSEELATQSRVSDDLLLSYREQFNVGRRSLLDVLDAQNTRYNVQVRLETAKFAEQFAEYQVLAATNKLLTSMSLATPASATSDARSRFDYGPPPPAELQRRRYPR
jgi:outer membrane protein, adhesin transport system